ATQSEVAFDRFLLAYLSRFKPGHLFAELVKDFGWPAIIPRLDHSPALPMQRVRQQKPRRITQVRSLMYNHQSLASISLQTHDFREHPILPLAPLTAFDLERTETLRMIGAQLLPNFIHSPPLPHPVDVARAFDLRQPMVGALFNQPRQLQRQHPVVERVVRFHEMAFVLDLPHDHHRHLRPLAIGLAVALIGEQLHNPLLRRFHLRVALLPGHYQILLFCFGKVWLLHFHRQAVHQLAIRHYRRHHCLEQALPTIDLLIRPFDPVDLLPALVMRLRPIQTDHFASAPTMIRCDDGAVRPHQLRARPTSLEHPSVHRSPCDLFPFRPDLLRIDPLQGLVLRQHQSAHISADVIEAFISTENFTVFLHSSSDCQRYSYQRKHQGDIPCLPTIIYGVRLAILLLQRLTFQVVY